MTTELSAKVKVRGCGVCGAISATGRISIGQWSKVVIIFVSPLVVVSCPSDCCESCSGVNGGLGALTTPLLS